MENLIQVILSMGSLEAAISSLAQCMTDKNHFLGLTLSTSFSELFPNNLDICFFRVNFLLELNKFETCFDYIEKILQFANIPEDKLKIFLQIQARCIPHIESRYTNYNEEITTKLYNKSLGQITFTITTCKRLDLFTKTMNSFLNACTDLTKIDRWLCVDDNSSEEDRKEMQKLYPFFEFYFKTPDEKGHANSMNIILQKVDTPYIFHIEDDWQFFAKKPYISLCLEILHQNKNLAQCLINKNYAETADDFRILGGVYNHCVSGLRYVVHEHTNNQDEFNRKHGEGPSCAYWPHYSLRPSLIKMAALRKVGNYNPEAAHFEREYADRYVSNGFFSAFLEGIFSRHIGRLTTERDTEKQNAYNLNNESQFVRPQEKENSILSQPLNIILPPEITRFEPETVQIPTFVINLDSRPDRWEKFQRENVAITGYERISAVDGNKLKNSVQLQRIFDGNDYNMKRGMVGCALSHIKLWIDFQERKEDVFCVLEDDATVTENFVKKVSVIPKNFDICFLGHHVWKHNESHELFNRKEYPTIRKFSAKEAIDFSMGGTAGYLITKTGAEKMLKFISKLGMKNCIDTMMQKAGDYLELFYSFPQLVFSPCPSTEKVDSDIQYNNNSLTISTNEKHEAELKYLLILSNVGRITENGALAQFFRSGVKLKQNIFYDGPDDILMLSENCPFPHYTIDNKVIYIIPEFTDKIVDERWVKRLMDHNNVFSLKGIEFLEAPIHTVATLPTKHFTDNLADSFKHDKPAVIAFGDCSHTYEAIAAVHKDPTPFPFDVIEGHNFKTCALLTELILEMSDSEIERFVRDLCDPAKHFVSFQAWNKKNVLQNKKYNISFPHEDASELITIYSQKFKNLKNAILNSSSLNIVNCARWKNVDASEYFYFYDLLHKYNKNVRILTVNGMDENTKIEPGKNITIAGVEFPQQFRNDEWPASKVEFDQKVFRLSILSPVRKFLS